MQIESLLEHLGIFIYGYCVDFIINLANLTNSSYYEVNFVIFIIIYPLISVLFLFIYSYLRFKLWKLKMTK